MKKLALFGALLAALACSGTKTKAGGGVAAGSELSPDAVVATYGTGQKITAKELDEKAADQLQQLETKKFQIRRQTLEQMVVEKLLDAEAAKRGMTQEAYLKSEIDDKIPKPSEEEMKGLFEQNSAQLPPGATFEEYKDRISEFMVQPKKQERARQLFDDLKKTANIDIKLQEPRPPRKTVEAKGPSRGPENAKVTIVEFSDFQCPFCSRAHDTVEQVMQTYAGKVRLVFRQFPLEFHKNAPKAAEAALCANEQGKFWEYHDVLFKNQQKLEVPDLKEHAGTLGLDGAKFGQCLDSGKFTAGVKEDQAAGQKVGVNGTPAFFINGVFLSGAQPFEEFKKVIDEELKGS
jgi:protein-disulfide isomerase